MHRSLLFTITLSLFAITMPVTSEEPNQHEIYFGHLEYEYGNRARTYIGMEVAAKASSDSDRGPFFQAYYEMEKLNQEIYGHMKGDLDVDYQVNWFVGMGVKAIGYLGWRFLDGERQGSDRFRESALLSVTTFSTFPREFSPLGACPETKDGGPLSRF